MLIQKTFHLRMAKEVAKAKLVNVAGYYRHVAGIKVFAINAGGVLHLGFRMPCGFWSFNGKADFVALESENPNQTLFRSFGGNIEAVGVVEYFEIRPNVTEVVFTLDYTIGSRMVRTLDFLFHSMDGFLNRQLEQVEACFAPVAATPLPTNLGQPLNGQPRRGKLA